MNPSSGTSSLTRRLRILGTAAALSTLLAGPICPTVAQAAQYSATVTTIAAPTGLAGVAGDKQVSLTWAATSGAVQYRLFRNSTLVGYPTSASFTDTGLTNGTSYAYYVRAVSSTGVISDASTTISATPVSVAVIPAPPTGLTGKAGDTKATLSWIASSGATSYRVLRDTVQIGTSTTPSFADSGLTNGKTYTYTVKAVNSAGVSGASNAATVTPLGAPASPTAVVAKAGDATVALSWQASSGATSYSVQRDGVSIGSSAAASFTDSGLTNGTTYAYTVTAANSVGTSAPSASVSATPVATVVAASTTPTRLAWFYKPPSSGESTVLKEFDSFVLTKGDETFVSKVRAAQPGAKVIQYFLLNQVVKPDSGGVEWRNNAANQPGDFNDLWTNHYGWFLKDTNGNPIHDSAGKFYMMDPGNEDWRSYWLKKFTASNVGWDGLFLDNVDLSLISVERYGVKARDYTTDDAFTTAIAGFLSRIHSEYAVPSGKPVSGNLINGSSTRNGLPKYIGSLDGYMEEAFGADWHTGYLSASAWNAQLDRVDSFTSAGKSPILVAQSDSQTDYAREKFTFASYLLVSGPTVSFRFTKSGAYGTPWMYDNYGTLLGSPTGPRRTLGDGTVRRDFQGGYVTVNPTTHEASIVTN